MTCTFANRLLACTVLAIACSPAFAGDVSLLMNGSAAKTGTYPRSDVTSLVINNGLLSVTFSKDELGDLTATSMIKNGKELLHNLNGKVGRDPYLHRSFYIDWGGSAGTMMTQKVRIDKITPEMAAFTLIDDGTRSGPQTGRGTGAPQYLVDHHLIMRSDTSGLYGYAVVRTTRAGSSNEIRTMYRFDRSIFDWAWNDERTGQQPTYAECANFRDAGDETWVLPEESPYRKFTGEIYQKYDYSAYYSESPMFGHYGHGFGAWFIPVNDEYYGGGPLKQELIVHQDALILNYIQGEHYGAGNLRYNAGYEKMFGPWLVYINAAPEGAAVNWVIEDGLKKAREEQARWPYAWLDDPLYQPQRTTVSGQLKIPDGRSVAGAWVVLAEPGGRVYEQMGKYIYYVKAAADGSFTIPAVRPGTYALYSWENQGPVTEELEKDSIEVKGDKLSLGEVDWSPVKHNQLLWQIGKADRMSGEFKFGNEGRSRTWISKVPANLKFTIGKSKEAEDWYYAQPAGNWDIVFNLDKVPSGRAYLTMPIAGGGGNVTILVNGQQVGTIQKVNESSVARATMRSGVYQWFGGDFDAKVLLTGENTIRLTAGRGSTVMWDTILLESD